MNKTILLRTAVRAVWALAFWTVQAAVAGTPSITTGGDAEWTEESAGCWRSGAIADNQSSWLAFTVDDAPCGVSFRWKTSSEDGCDKLHCYLDGTEALPAISGEMDEWEEGALLVAESGSHAIRFEYAKDSSVLKGDDCGWVKNFAVSAVSVRTLALDGNGGAADISEITVADGYAVGALPDAVWRGEGHFRFLGWCTQKDGGEQVTSVSICQEGWTTLFAQWREMHPPANDNFADAAAISGTTGSVDGSTIDSSRETVDLIPDKYYSGYGSTVWYRWTAPEDGTYAFTVADAEGRGWSAAVGVTTGYEGEEGTWSGSVVNWQRTMVQAIQGDTYWIEVGIDLDYEFEFTLSWHKHTPPANDNFADAVTIFGATGSVEGTIIDSTGEAVDLIPDVYYFGYSSTVWYRWTVPEDGTYAFSIADADGERGRSAAVGVTTGYDAEEGAWSGSVVNWQRTTVQAIQGVVYWIEVGSSIDQELEFTLSWKKLNPPANDNFADAVTISGTTGSVEGTTIDSEREATDLIPDRYDHRDRFTVWYKWTAPEDGAYVFTVADADEDRGWGAAVGVTTGYDAEAEAWSGSDVNWRQTGFQALQGVTYWIEVGSDSYDNEGFEFTLSWAKLNPPGNDNFADAASISGTTGSVEGSTIDSTREAADLIPDRYDNDCRSTVWYKWTASEDGTYAFTVADAEGRGWSAAVGMTTGYEVEDGVWFDAIVIWQRTTIQAIKGVTYWIEVGSYTSEELDFTLSWKKLNPPANDDFADAVTISGATGSVEGTTIDSTRETADLIPGKYYSDHSSTVWYRWTAPEDGVYAFTVADADEKRGWYAAVGVTTGYDAEEGAWSGASVNWRQTRFQAIQGVTYWIEVGSDSYDNEEFEFTLSWAKLNPPANDDFADATAISGGTGSIEGTNIDSTRATADLIPDEYYYAYGSTVWYQWTAPEDGVYAFTVADADEERGWGAAVGVTTGYDGEKGAWSDAAVNWTQTRFQAIQDVTYWIEVGSDSYNDREFEFTLSWAKLNPPANDNFANATTISGAKGSIEGTNIASTRETADLIPDWYWYDEEFGDCDYSDETSTVWYQWTAPEDGEYVFTVADADEMRRMRALVGVTTGYDGEEGAWSGAAVNWTQTRFQAIQGVTYWMEVGLDSEFDFTLSWHKFNPPANDNFADAMAISGAVGSIAGTTIDSSRETADLIPDCYAGSYTSTVWYQWTAPEDGDYVFTVTGAVVGVTRGYDGEEENWSGSDANWQRIRVQTIRGVTYWIEVGSYASDELDFTLSWREFVPPANDNFADAIGLEGISGSTTGSNLGASVEEGEPLSLEVGGLPFGTTASVWWRWNAPENGSFTVSTEGSDFDTVLGVYTGTSVDGLSTVAANDDGGGGGGTSIASFGATAGTVYYFAVGGFNSGAGNIVLSWKRAGSTGDVIVDAGGGKTVTVPGAWLAANTTRAATDMAANGRLLVWQCYVLGLDPEGTEDFRIVSFSMNADGTPDLEHIGVHPDPATWNVPATLQLKGAATLAGPWNDVPGDGDAACRFFSAGVVLP